MLLVIDCIHSAVLQIEKLGDTYYLLKRNVVLADTGKYICVASNEIGKAHCSAFVTVIGDSSYRLHAFRHIDAILSAHLAFTYWCLCLVSGKNKTPEISTVTQAKSEWGPGYTSEEVNVTTAELVQAHGTHCIGDQRPVARCHPIR